MKALSKPLSEFSFVARERQNGETVAFKCGRDFLYYALHFYQPEMFNAEKLSPVEIDRQRLFGTPMPKRLAWTQLQFSKLPKFLKRQGYVLYINDKKISSYRAFVWANLFSGLKTRHADPIQKIERLIESNVPCAIDIPIKKGLLVLIDHVMFVYGYDEKNLYVLDTLTVPGVGYEKVEGQEGLYRLRKTLVEEKWSIFGRVWRLEKA